MYARYCQIYLVLVGFPSMMSCNEEGVSQKLFFMIRGMGGQQKSMQSLMNSIFIQVIKLVSSNLT